MLLPDAEPEANSMDQLHVQRLSFLMRLFHERNAIMLTLGEHRPPVTGVTVCKELSPRSRRLDCPCIQASAVGAQRGHLSL
jgi:hypothetical protein